MNRLLLSTAVLAMIAAPTIAEAKKTTHAPAKHKVVKAATVKTTTQVKGK